MKLTYISIQKLTDVPEPGSKKPTHNLIGANKNDKGEYVDKTTIGSFWTRESQYGKFLSGEMKKARSHEGKDYDGYVIITEKEWDEYQALKASNTTEGKGYDGSVTDTTEIDWS